MLSWSQNILIDGKFDDWESITPIEDATNSGSNLDLQRLWIHSDQQFVYLSFELRQEILLQEDNDLAIFIDFDENEDTGSTNTNSRGADLIFEFGERDGLLFVDGLRTSINHADVGYVSAPTVSSRRFEIAFRRDDDFYGEMVFSAPTVRAFMLDQVGGGDRIPDMVTLDHELIDIAPITVDYNLKKDVNDLRVLSFNVQNDAIFENNSIGAFRRIIRAIQPDIIAFQEINDNSEADVQRLMEDIMPTASTGETWTISKVLPDIIMVSKFQLIGSLTIDESSSGSSGNGVFVYDLPQCDEDLIFINCHLPCCQSNDSRQDEVDAVMSFVREYKAGRTQFETKLNSPIIIAGDMNLVGFDEQLTTFLTGDIQDEGRFGSDFIPDWDDSDFEDALPYNTNYPTTFTWYNPNSSFNPGRLDFIIYTGSVMDLTNSFSLFTSELPNDTLSTYNLNATDIAGASDHLPIVADFRLRKTTSTNEVASVVKDFEITPNPVTDDFSVQFQLEKQQLVVLSLTDSAGKLIETIKNERLTSGYHSFSLSGKELSAGLYFLNLKTEEGSTSIKLIKN